MKRIYITAVPLPSNFILKPQKVECVNLDLRSDDQLIFPISRLIEATMRDGDEAEIITVRQTNASGDENMNRLKQDLAALHIRYQIKDITTPENQNKDALLDLFKQLAQAIDPQCCIYADSTFGTKTYPIILFAALNYAEKIKECELHCLMYQEQRRDAQTHETTGTYLYDITSLFYLNSVVDAMSQSEASITQKDALLDSLLNL